MTLRLGFVGCGKWARKLAESFRACGAEVVAYDRREPHAHRCHCGHYLDYHPRSGACTAENCECRGFGGTEPATGFGSWMPWRDQLADKSIDAIVAVAPPEITTEVAMACAAAGKAVMATKPLFDHPERITAPFYVDFWRLWANAHQEAKSSVGHLAPYVLKGSGPVRSFSGALDYGPHVMAALLDLAPVEIFRAVNDTPATGDLFTVSVDLRGGRSTLVQFGNGSQRGEREIWGAAETPTHIGDEPKEAIMQKFCRSFLSDVSDGFVSTTLRDYSREGMRMLREIRERAK